MDQPKQPQGNFVMNINFRRKGNEKAPPITGRISTPEDPEAQFSFSCFEHADKNGEIYWIGPVDVNTSLRAALNTTPKQGHNFVTVRMNGFKVFKENIDGSLNPAYAALNPEQQKAEDAKPAFWGSWTRDPDNDPVLKHAAWERDPSRYGPWASGNTQHPLTKDEADRLKAGQAPAMQLQLPEPKAQPARTGKSRTDTGRAA